MPTYKMIIACTTLAVFWSLVGCSRTSHSSLQGTANDTLAVSSTTASPATVVITEPSTTTPPPVTQTQATTPPTTPAGPSSADLAAKKEADYQQFQLDLFHQCMATAEKYLNDRTDTENRYKSNMQRDAIWSDGMEQVHQQTLAMFQSTLAGDQQACRDIYNSVR